MRTIIIFLLYFIGQFLYGQEPINIRAPLRQVYNGDTCLTYFNGDTTVLECPTQTYYKIGTSLNVMGDLYVNGEILNDLITNTIIIYGDTSSTSVNFSDSANYSDTANYANSANTANSTDTANYANSANTSIYSTRPDSTFGGLTVTGNSDLNGILFTGATKTAGAWYLGSTVPTNTNLLNFDGKIRITSVRVGEGGTMSSGILNEFVYNSNSYGAIFQLENASVVPLSIIHTGTITEENSSSFLRLNREYSGNYNSTGNIINIIDNPTTSGTISGKVLSATIGSTERISLNPRVSSSGTSVAYMFDTHNNLNTEGDLIADFKNSGTSIFKIANAKTAGAFYVGASNPSNSNRLNYDGDLYSRKYLTVFGLGSTIPAFTFHSDDNTGISSSSDDVMGLVAGSSYVFGVSDEAAKESGVFYPGTTVPTNSGRLNYDGNLYATSFFTQTKVNYAQTIATTTDGDLLYETTQDKMYMYTNGIGGWCDKAIFKQLADVTRTGAVTAQSLVDNSNKIGTTTLPANFFKSGKTLRYRIVGVYTTDISAGNATVTMTIGGTTFRTTGSFALDNSVTNGFWQIEGEITCRTAGVSGTLSGLMSWAHVITDGSGFPMHHQPTTTITAVTYNTTASGAFDVVWTADDAGTSITCTNVTLWEVF